MNNEERLVVPPPYNRRCQARLSHWYRCEKAGTHWASPWPGCPCTEHGQRFSCASGCKESQDWVCDGPHLYEEMLVGEPPLPTW